MSVLMMPGLSGTAAMPGGNSCASACVKPSIAHFVAQYGATSAAVERPQPELKLTMTPLPAFDHCRHEMADDVRHALEVHVNHVGKFLRADFPEPRVAVDERRRCSTANPARREISKSVLPRPRPVRRRQRPQRQNHAARQIVFAIARFPFPNVRSRARCGRAG